MTDTKKARKQRTTARLEELGKRRKPERTEKTVEKKPNAPEMVRPVQFYIGESTQNVLRRTRAAGLIRNIDITNSAIVRYAIGRLAAEMTYDQIIESVTEELPSLRRGQRF